MSETFVSNRTIRAREKLVLLRAAGLCCTCGKQPSENNLTRCRSCIVKDALRQARRRNNLTEAGLCNRCGKNQSTNTSIWCDKCNKYKKQNDHKIRELIINNYGGCCAVCGELISQFLTIDHVDGGGREHRRSLKIVNLTRWLYKHNCPSGFQILCWNHNFLKHLESIVHTSARRTKTSAYLIKMRKDVFDAYGNNCECCGVDDLRLLTIDHQNDDGAKERSVYGYGSHFYKWLRQNHYPSGYRVLCHNCNSGRAINGGVCPHG